MECYIKGMFGKIREDDSKCKDFIDDYNRPQQLCNGEDAENPEDSPICKAEKYSQWPCGCTGINNKSGFGSNAFKTGFKSNQGDGGLFLMQNTGTVDECSEGESKCTSFRDVICKQIGVQITGLEANGACPA